MTGRSEWMGKLSRVRALPLVGRLSPSQENSPTEADLAGYAQAQSLARKAAVEVASLMQVGWTEIQAADLLGSYLRDHGVKAFFHHPFAWYGPRTRFRGIRAYGAYRPTDRRLQPDEPFILDVAPILDGYVCDIGYSACLGENPEWDRAKAWLRSLREELPRWFEAARTGGEVWRRVDEKIRADGFDNIHKKYPFGVLGHRVPRVSAVTPPLSLLHFGWQSYWSLASRGLFGQLLASFHEGGLKGLWAVEPHIGLPAFGVKFEEILVVDDGGCRWLQKEFL